MAKLITRRQFIRTSVAGSLSLVALGCSALPGYAKQRKPNIVFILADDQGLHQVGCYGNGFYETPSIDHLAKEGMKFTDAYAAAPVCSPTRASIMTGKYPARLGLTNWIKGHVVTNAKLKMPNWTKHLSLEQKTIPEALEPAGYVCGHFGKWHLNKDTNYKRYRPGDPGSQGFLDVFTTRKPAPDAKPESDPHHVAEITDRAIVFMEENKSKPFFCYITHNSIHRPVIERAELAAKYVAKPGVERPENSPVLGAMVETLDKSVGDVLDKLDELGIADDTIVIYFSDNGAFLARDELKPLRGGKAQLYEGGIRVPLIVRWPRVIEPGTHCDVPVSSVDFFPTFLEIAGRKNTNREIDGESILPLFNKTGQLEREAIYWHYPHYHSVGIAPSGAIRCGSYKLIEWYEKSIDGVDTAGAIELFNLEEDISEQNDLVKKMPEKAAQLYKKLRQWRKSVNAQEMVKNTDYNLQKK